MMDERKILGETEHYERGESWMWGGAIVASLTFALLYWMFGYIGDHWLAGLIGSAVALVVGCGLGTSAFNSKYRTL